MKRAPRQHSRIPVSMRTRVLLAMLLLVVAACGGCESAPGAARPQSPESRRSATTSQPRDAASEPLSPAAAALRERLTNTSSGLEVRRLYVLDDSDRIIRAITTSADGPATEPEEAQRLKRNGLRLVRIPLDRVSQLISDLGQATYDATEWHGQVPEWRPLVERLIEPGGRAVAIDGAVGLYETGMFRIMLRAWTVQMEDGPCMHLEMMPTRRLPHTNDIRSMLANRAEPDQTFPSMAVDVRLQATHAYALLCESPQIDWPGLDAANDGAAEGAAASQTALRVRARSRIGPLDGVGPDAAAPPTLGELMLRHDRQPVTRTVLLLIPKVPPELFVPEQLAGLSDPSPSGGR